MNAFRIAKKSMIRRRMGKLCTLCAILALCGMRPTPGFPQSATTGGINGTVVDSSGAAVPGATITITDLATRDQRVLTSNEGGRFTVPFLKPDNFEISATAGGLHSTKTTVQVFTGQQSAVNLSLAPNATTETGAGPQGFAAIVSDGLPGLSNLVVTADASGNVMPIGPVPSPQTNYGNVPRNAFYDPHYSDVDLDVYKDVFKHESITFPIGAQAYNALNHVNFAAPQSNASNPSTLGQIASDVNAPTSPYGSSQESTVSGRVLVVQGRFLF